MLPWILPKSKGPKCFLDFAKFQTCSGVPGAASASKGDLGPILYCGRKTYGICYGQNTDPVGHTQNGRFPFRIFKVPGVTRAVAPLDFAKSKAPNVFSTLQNSRHSQESLEQPGHPKATWGRFCIVGEKRMGFGICRTPIQLGIPKIQDFLSNSQNPWGGPGLQRRPTADSALSTKTNEIWYRAFTRASNPQMCIWCRASSLP